MRAVNDSVRVKAQVVHRRQARQARQASHGRSSECPRDDRQFTRIGPDTPQSLRPATFLIHLGSPAESTAAERNDVPVATNPSLGHSITLALTLANPGVGPP